MMSKELKKYLAQKVWRETLTIDELSKLINPLTAELTLAGEAKLDEMTF